MMKISKKQFLGALLLVVILAFAYGNIVNNQFLSDDYDWIRESRIHVESGDWGKVFTEKIGGNFYRPIVFFSFQVDYFLFGYSATGYYLHQLIFFAVLVAGVYVLMKLLFKDTFLAFSTAIIFLLWPAHHEVVTWLAGRPDLYAATFGVWSAICFVYAIKSERLRYWVFFLASLIFFLLSILSKESTFILPGLFVLISAILLSYTKVKKKVVLKSIFTLLGYTAPLAFVLYERGKILTDSLGGYRIGQQKIFLNFPIENMTRPFRSMTYVINWPYALNRFAENEMVQTAYKVFTYLERYIYIAIALLFLALLWNAIKHKTLHSIRPYIFSILWAIIAFIPVYGVANVINYGLGNSRFFFFASIGFAVLFAWMIQFLFKKLKKVKIIILSFFCFLLFASLQFNAVPWESASRMVKNLKTSYIEQQDEIISLGQNHLIVTNIPRRVFDAYIFYRENSIQEALYSTGVEIESINDYGSSKPWPGPYCKYAPSDSIQVIRWDSDLMRFAVSSNDENEMTRLALLEEVGVKYKWDFSKEEDYVEWNFSGDHQWQDDGVAFTLSDNSDFMEFEFDTPQALSRYTHMKVLFEIEGDVPASAYQILIAWTKDDTYSFEDKILYPLSGSNIIDKKIPLCPYTSWMSSVNIKKIKLRPLNQGNIIVKGITLLSE